jgi:hypothetical protein
LLSETPSIASASKESDTIFHAEASMYELWTLLYSRSLSAKKTKVEERTWSQLPLQHGKGFYERLFFQVLFSQAALLQLSGGKDPDHAS